MARLADVLQTILKWKGLTTDPTLINAVFFKAHFGPVGHFEFENIVSGIMANDIKIKFA